MKRKANTMTFEEHVEIIKHLSEARVHLDAAYFKIQGKYAKTNKIPKQIRKAINVLTDVDFLNLLDIDLGNVIPNFNDDKDLYIAINNGYYNPATITEYFDSQVKDLII